MRASRLRRPKPCGIVDCRGVGLSDKHTNARRDINSRARMSWRANDTRRFCHLPLAPPAPHEPASWDRPPREKSNARGPARERGLRRCAESSVPPSGSLAREGSSPGRGACSAPACALPVSRAVPEPVICNQPSQTNPDASVTRYRVHPCDAVVTAIALNASRTWRVSDNSTDRPLPASVHTAIVTAGRLPCRSAPYPKRAEPGNQGLRLTCHLGLTHDPVSRTHHTNARTFERSSDPRILLHGCPPMMLKRAKA
jgi:hypothetical protein